MYEVKVRPDCQNYTSLLHAYAVRGEPNECVFWLEKMHLAKLVPDAVSYCTVIDAYAKVEEKLTNKMFV